MSSAPATADHVPTQPDTHVYTMTFQTSGQSIFGPIPSLKPSDKTFPLVSTSWTNKSDSTSNKTTVAGSQFGGGISGNTEGQFKLQAEFRDFDTGSVSANYPVEVTLFTPVQDSYRVGDLITIDSKWVRKPGASLTTTPPGGFIDVNGTLGLAASASAEVCLFACAGGLPLLPPFDGNNPPFTSSLIVNPVTQQLGPISSKDRFEIPVLTSNKTGVGGHFGLPNVQTTDSIADDGISLEASGTDENSVALSGDIDTWAGNFGAPFPLGFDTGPIAGARFRYNILDLSTNFRMTQREEFKFTPTVMVRLDFPQAVRFTVRNQSGGFVSSGVSAQVTFEAGHRVEIVAPSNEIQVTPNFFLRNTFSHDASTTFTQDLVVKAAEFFLQVPKKTVIPGVPKVTKRVCAPDFLGGDCETITVTPEIPPVESPDFNLNIGPLFTQTLAERSFTDELLFDGNIAPWELGGFNTVTETSFELNPQFKPNAVITTTSQRNEGDGLGFGAGSSRDRDNNLLSYSWNFGDGITATGKNVSHAYADNGNFDVRLTVDDGHGVPGTATTRITINNVPPVLTAGSNKTVNEGDVTGLGSALFGTNLIGDSGAENSGAGWAGNGGFTTKPYGPKSQGNVGDLSLFGENKIINGTVGVGVAGLRTDGWTRSAGFSTADYGDPATDTLPLPLRHEPGH